jgi:AraC-like DNA-binding protein
VDDLIDVVRARTAAPGMTASAIPGVWLIRVDRPTPLGPGCTPTMMVAFATQGKKRVRVGGLDLSYDARSYLVMRGETEYEAQIVEASPTRPYLAVGIQIPPDVVVHTMLALADHRPAAAVEPQPAFTAPLDERLLGALGRLLGCLDDAADRQVLAPLILREIVFHLLRSEAAAVLRPCSNPSEHARIRQAIAYIEQRAAQRLSVETIARHVAMSPSHFAHRFREVASLSPMQYLKHVRLERARTLLVADGMSAAEVARVVGYASASHFTRDFKRQFGLAPTGYTRAFAGDGTAPAPLDAAALSP